MNEQESKRVYHFKGFTNKKKLFEELAEILSKGEGPSFHRVLDGLNAREKLGSTCIDKGVAIPHCKLSIDSPRGVIMILEEPVKYSDQYIPDADIIFGLIVPSDNCDQHLHLLSSIAKLCETESWLDGLRALESQQAIVNYISDIDTRLADIL